MGQPAWSPTLFYIVIDSYERGFYVQINGKVIVIHLKYQVIVNYISHWIRWFTSMPNSYMYTEYLPTTKLHPFLLQSPYMAYHRHPKACQLLTLAYAHTPPPKSHIIYCKTGLRWASNGTWTCKKLWISDIISESLWVSKFKFLTPNEDHGLLQQAQVTFWTLPTQ